MLARRCDVFVRGVCVEADASSNSSNGDAIALTANLRVLYHKKNKCSTAIVAYRADVADLYYGGDASKSGRSLLGQQFLHALAAVRMVYRNTGSRVR
jgi:hypothetical protein